MDRTRSTAGVCCESCRALDLLVGTLPLGTLVGAASSDHPRVQAGLEPVYADGCVWRLDPGASYEGTFSVHLKDALASGYELELAIEDGLSRQTDAVHFMLDEAPPAGTRRVPPLLALTQDVLTWVSRPEVRLSGRVTHVLRRCASTGGDRMPNPEGPPRTTMVPA